MPRTIHRTRSEAYSEDSLVKAALERRGTTATEWFSDSVAELIAPSLAEYARRIPSLRALNELENDETVKNSLRAINWEFATDKTNYFSHDIHPYPAKFIPQIPLNIIPRLSLRGERVWDPFGGSGTTALESVLLGRQAISSDVNPIAEVIGRAKLLTLTKEEEDDIEAFVEALRVICSQPVAVGKTLIENKEAFARFIPDIPNVAEWFDEHAVHELAYIRWQIETHGTDPILILGRACLSKVIVRASFQDSETRYVRKRREVKRGETIQLFCAAMSSALQKLRPLGAMLKFASARFHTSDLRYEKPVTNNSVDLIVTSPPYPNATDYHLYHRFRLFWLGHDPRDLGRKEIGSHLRHQKEGTGVEAYVAEMHQCLAQMFAALKPGRLAVLIVGDAIFNGTVCDTQALLSGAAEQTGFAVIGNVERRLPLSRRSFIPAARRLKTERLLILRKPAAESVINIFPPPYKLWPHERRIRERELNCLTGQNVQTNRRGAELRVRLNSLRIDRLRRLTFSHSFDAANIDRELTWQTILENGEAGRSARKDAKYVTHGIHGYKGKFYPQLCKSLFNLARLEPGMSVLDPFCGSGTTCLEAHLNGLKGIGFDLSPIAVKIARAKTAILTIDPYHFDRQLARFESRLSLLNHSKQDRRVFDDRLLPEIDSWFPAPVVEKLGGVIHLIDSVADSRFREFLEVILSSTVRDVSQQDPKDLRIRRRVPQIKDAPVLELFARRLHEQRRRMLEFAQRSNKAPSELIPAEVYEGDSRRAETFAKAGIGNAAIHALVTSPPYATALPYIDTDRLSILLFCKLGSRERVQIEEDLTGSREIKTQLRKQIEQAIEAKQFESIPSNTARKLIADLHVRNASTEAGFRKRAMAALLYRYFRDMAKAMANVSEVLRPGGSAFFVLGDNYTQAGGRKIIIKSCTALKEIAANLRWKIHDVIPISVTTENRLNAKNSITRNEIIWFKKRD